jgi:hypothetical protein
MDNVTNVANNDVLPTPVVAPEGPYKSMEFEAFLTILEDTPVNNWTIIAQGLGVDRLTVLRWRKHPRAQKILREALQEAIDGMKQAGKDDWRMWRELAKMFGIEDTNKIEITNLGEVLDNLEGKKTKYDELGRAARRQVVENDPPIQDIGQGGEPSNVSPELPTA